MSAGIGPMTPESVAHFIRWSDRWSDRWTAAYHKARASKEWTDCTCETCSARRHIEIERHMDAE